MPVSGGPLAVPAACAFAPASLIVGAAPAPSPACTQRPSFGACGWKTCLFGSSTFAHWRGVPPPLLAASAPAMPPAAPGVFRAAVIGTALGGIASPGFHGTGRPVLAST